MTCEAETWHGKCYTVMVKDLRVRYALACSILSCGSGVAAIIVLSGYAIGTGIDADTGGAVALALSLTFGCGLLGALVLAGLGIASGIAAVRDRRMKRPSRTH